MADDVARLEAQVPGRRVVMAVVLSPFALFSKNRKHYVTFSWKDADGKDQAAVLQFDKNDIRPAIAIMKARTGKDITFQDEDAQWLLSALRSHRLTTMNPFEVWMAIGHKAWRPKVAEPPLRLVHMSGPPAAAGVETHTIEGVRVRVVSAAKTVADCFRFRNKIGLDVALETLRDYKHRHRTDLGTLWRFASVCRVSRVMQPYLDAMS